MSKSFDRQVGDAAPIFRIETDANGLHESGDVSPVCTAGTRLFVFDREIPLLQSFKYEVNYGGSDDIPITTITISVAGSVVATDIRKFDGA